MYSLGMNGFWKKPENWYGVLQATSVFDHALVSLSSVFVVPFIFFQPLPCSFCGTRNITSGIHCLLAARRIEQVV